MMAETLVYKIVNAAEWASAARSGAYGGSPDDERDGYIHLSSVGQLIGTLTRHFENQRGLVLVEFDAKELEPALRWEPSRNGALFPHLYGPLPTAAARRVTPLANAADGTIVLPEEFARC